MQADLINVCLAFIEGLLLIISPCILPILPIILSGSLTGAKSRPLGIVTGFVLTFTIVTLFSRSLIHLTHINENTLRAISFGILIIFALIMISETMTEKFTAFTQRLTGVGQSFHTANDTQSGFWGGILFGGLVGIIWTPCAGPILAAVIVQVVLQETTLSSMLVVIAFAIGAGIPMLFIAWFGRTIVSRMNFLRGRAIVLRKILGFIIILSVLYLAFFPGSILSLNQSGSQFITKSTSLINGLEHPYKAPEIKGIDVWINSKPLNWDDLKGKVVLVDFWTYSCINCIRTLPYLRDWYAKYHDKGFEIIGVHSPEFQFEHNVNNVREAVTNFEMTYPVALDNQFATWQNFKNEYWPAHYLVNKEGDIVYIHFGEGEYDVTENNIRYLLGMDLTNADLNSEDAFAANLTPETYFGSKRAERFAGPEAMMNDKAENYTYPAGLSINSWALHGNWMVTPEKIVSVSPDAAIKLHFKAGKVYMVMGVAKAKDVITVKILLNGKPVGMENSGADAVDSQIEVNQNRLYSLVKLSKGNEGTLEVIANSPGLEVYTFTFGN